MLATGVSGWCVLCDEASLSALETLGHRRQPEVECRGDIVHHCVARDGAVPQLVEATTEMKPGGCDRRVRGGAANSLPAITIYGQATFVGVPRCPTCVTILTATNGLAEVEESLERIFISLSNR